MKKILLTILSLFLLTGCFSFREKSNSRPAITIDTDYLSGDASYLYYYQSYHLKKKKFMKIFIIAFLIMQKRSQSAVMIMN